MRSLNKIFKCVLVLIMLSLVYMQNSPNHDYQANTSHQCEDLWSFQHLIPDDKVEIHEIFTSDSYILALFRARNGNPDSATPFARKTILLLHGAGVSADDFALSKNSVVKSLLKQNYDVWLLNNRGNKYSCKNRQIDTKSTHFWNFSFQEMAEFDFSSALYHITKVTGQKVTVIGHSQGATQVIAALSVMPHLNSQIEKFIAIAPIVSLTGSHQRNNLVWGTTRLLIHALRAIKVKSIFNHKVNSNFITDFAIKLFCLKTQKVCDKFISIFFDKDPSQIDREELNHYLKHNPSRTSTKSIEHIAQLGSHSGGQLRKFDYGRKRNQEVYRSDTPPAYNMSNIATKVYLHYGDNDFLCTDKSIKTLITAFKVSKTRFYRGWGHLSFILGKDRQEFLDALLADIEDDS